MTSSLRPDLYPGLDYLGRADRYVDDIFNVIREKQLFESFSFAEIEGLCQYMHCFAAPRETPILLEGDTGDYLLVLLTGKVAVRKRDKKGESVGIAVVGPGSVLGEMALFDGEQRFATCVTVEPTDFAVMSRADLNEILIQHPRMANKFMIRMLNILIERMREMGYRVIDSQPMRAE